MTHRSPGPLSPASETLAQVAPTGRPGEHWLVLEHATRALSSPVARKFA